MTSIARSPASPVVRVRRRRAFGLDVPRPPSLARTEAAIVDWLSTRLPRLVWLRVEGGPAAGREATTLVLLLPGGRTALLRIDVGSGPPDAGATELGERCLSRRIPLAVVASLDEARAALRRLGHEPEEA